MAAAEPEGLASLLRASEGDTAAWVGHVVAFRAYLQRSDSPGLLNMSPPALQALVECVRTCVTGSEQDAEGERLTPLAEMLRALFDLLPKPQEGANIAQPDHPLVQPMRTLARTCIATAHAELRRPKPHFTLMNAVWKLLVRIGLTLPRPVASHSRHS